MTNNTYLSPTILASGVSLVDGGYVRIGNIVIINARLNVTTQISATSPIVSFPSMGVTTNVVTLQNNRNLDISMQENGTVSCVAIVPVGTLIINGVYCCS